jgi:hypothetical protein
LSELICCALIVNAVKSAIRVKNCFMFYEFLMMINMI